MNNNSKTQPKVERTVQTAASHWAEADNAFDGMPQHGTIVGVINSDLLEEMEKASIRNTAAERSKTATIEELVQIETRYVELWKKICRISNVPYAWPLSFDRNNGNLFINTK